MQATFGLGQLLTPIQNLSLAGTLDIGMLIVLIRL